MGAFSTSQMFGFYSEFPGRPLEESDIIRCTFWKDNPGCGLEKGTGENSQEENGAWAEAIEMEKVGSPRPGVNLGGKIVRIHS